MSYRFPNQLTMRELAAFIPKINRHAMVQRSELPLRTEGTALFADISGFTQLTRRLSRLLGRQKGAEAVLAQINPVYEEIITQLHLYGGSAINFMGDGVLCWFDESHGASCDKALATAIAIQQGMSQFSAVPLPNGEPVSLTIKIAVASGPAYHVQVGDPNIRLLKTMAGRMIHRVSQICALTRAGEIGLCNHCIPRFGDELKIVKRRIGDFVIIGDLEKAVLPAPWPALDDRHLLPEEIRPWLLSSIFDHIQNGGELWGDLRPVTPMMVRFIEPDFDDDPQAALKLNAYVSWAQRIIHKFGGNLIQFSVGDKGANLYAPFGAPIAHENDIERASLAALALHHPPKEIAPPGGIQIGLSRGNVWAGACGASARFTYGVMGDDVNLAARLMMKAAPGQTIVSERMMQQGRFNYHTLGEFPYKGFPSRVKTFELIDQKKKSEKRYETDLVERSAELDAFEAAVQPIFDGKFAGVLTVWGDAGIGKSHLINEFSKKIEAQVAWLEGSFDNLVRDSLAPFKQILHTYFDQSLEQSYDENMRRFNQRIANLIEALSLRGGAYESAQVELFRSQSVLAAMVGLHWEGSLYAELPPNLRFENQLNGFKNFVRALGLIQPVMMHLDDAHWIDEDSKEMVLALTRNCDDMPFGIILSSRYEGSNYPSIIDLPAQVQQQAFNLKELSSSGIMALISQILNSEITDKVIQYLEEKTNGNPLFVQQFGLNLQERQAMPRDELADTEELSLSQFNDMPETLNTVLVSRLDRLGDRVKNVVQAASVLGQEFDVKLVGKLLSTSQAELGQLIEAAEKAQIWSPVSIQRYMFRHVLMRDAAYGMQTTSRLEHLHLNAAHAILEEYEDQLEPHAGHLAYHFDLARRPEQAVHWYEVSAKQFSDQYANQEAIRACSRALELIPTDDLAVQFRLIKEREQIYGVIGSRTEQKEDIDRLIEVAIALSDPIYRAKAYFEEGNYFCRANDGEQTVAALKLAQQQLELSQEEDLDLKIKIFSVWAQACWQSGDFETAKEKLAIAYPLSKEVEPSQEASVQSILSIVHGISGDVEGAIYYAEKALVLHRAAKNRIHEGTTLNSLGIQARRKGKYSEAEKHYTAALKIMQDIGFRFGQSVLRNNLALIWLEQGRYAQAQGEILTSIELSRDLGILRNECWGLVYLSAIHLRLGENELGLQTARDLCQKVQDCGDPDLEGYAMLYLGLLLAGNKAWEEAKQALKKSVEIRHELKQLNLATEPMAALIEIALAESALNDVLSEAESIIERLDEDPQLAGPYEPFRVHYILYRFLECRQDSRAVSVLRRASKLLLDRASKISDPDMRKSYLENVIVHKKILETARILDSVA